MADDSSDEDLSRLVADLVRTLRELEGELEPQPPEDGPRLPTPRDLRRLTSEVAIPGLILVLETNIRALRLLQRALRLAEGADQVRDGTEELTDRARSASASTLDRLDDALVELQDAVEGRPNDDEAATLLEDARELRSEIQQRLRESTRRNGSDVGGSSDTAPGESGVAMGADGDDDSDSAQDSGSESDGGLETDAGSEPVAVDVDAELESIRSELDRAAEQAEELGRDATDDNPDSGDADGGETDGSGSDGNESDETGSDGNESDGDESDGTGPVGAHGAGDTDEDGPHGDSGES